MVTARTGLMFASVGSVLWTGPLLSSHPYHIRATLRLAQAHELIGVEIRVRQRLSSGWQCQVGEHLMHNGLEHVPRVSFVCRRCADRFRPQGGGSKIVIDLLYSL